MPVNPALMIRELKKEDRARWQILWRAYLEFYQTTLPAEMYDLAFQRLLSTEEGEMDGLIALKNSEAIGLAHTLTHRSGPLREKIVYLQDLFVSPSVRGTGVGRALIEEVYRRADAANTPRVYWLTASDNFTARRLYDRMASDSGFTKYKRHPS